MPNYSRTEENYIKAIYHLEAGGDSVSTNDLQNHFKRNWRLLLIYKT